MKENRYAMPNSDFVSMLQWPEKLENAPVK